MLQYVLAGLALGSIYAIASASLVVTFVSAGVLNFAFAGMAYFVARFYYFLNSQHGWPTDAAGVVAILGGGPLLGLALYGLVFRFIRGKTTLVKLVATIALSVALPVVADFLFGNQSITSAPGLAALKDQNHPFHFLGTPVTTDQVITYGFVLFVLFVGTAVLRFTDVGLKVRAMVDSEAMASLSGTNPSRVAMGVWAVSTALAGLAGILVAPSQGLTVAGMTTLMTAAFAAVVAARLRSLPAAVLISFLMGVVTDVIQKWLPPNSSFTAALIPSIPFAFILVFLIFHLIRSGSLDENTGLAGPLDQAIKPAHQETSAMMVEVEAQQGWWGRLPLIPLAVVGLLPLIFHGSSYYLGLAAAGLCYAIFMLTFTVVTGEGGMLWLSQIIFAGAGAIAAAQFAKNLHVPVLLAVFMGGVLAAVVGAVIGLLTIRLGDLYVALVTLTFGELIEGLVFTRERFQQGGLGVPINRPSFASSDLKFAYLAFAVFVIFAILTLNMRRSTSGLALRAVRDSEQASRTLGLSVLQVKVIVGAIAAFVAAVGGGFLAMDANVAQPQSFETGLGLVWLAVLVTMGIRSITAAALAGMAFSLMPGWFGTQGWVPNRFLEVPTLLFGLGAVGVVRNPEGVVLQFGRWLRRRAMGVLSKAPDSGTAATPGSWGQGDGAQVTAATVAAGGSVKAVQQ
jgi:branched-chain amino acid transport system permease protein